MALRAASHRADPAFASGYGWALWCGLLTGAAWAVMWAEHLERQHETALLKQAPQFERLGDLIHWLNAR